MGRPSIRSGATDLPPTAPGPIWPYFPGVDFNPAHVDSARRFVAAAGIGNVEFLERSFTELTAQDVPECDFIVLHGVYAWVSAEVRAGIQRVIRERLKPGGLKRPFLRRLRRQRRPKLRFGWGTRKRPEPEKRRNIQ